MVKKDKGIIPVGDRVLIRPLQEEINSKTKSGIILPDSDEKERPEKGEVIAVGEGKYENGKLMPIKIKKGDKVIFAKYGYEEVKIDDEEYLILKEDQILAIIK